MNMHMPQSLLTRAEVEMMMKVERNILTPQSNRPVMGIVQDTLRGAAAFTTRDTFLDKAEMMNILMFFPDWDGKIPVPAIHRPVELWTGKQLWSLMLPDVVNLPSGPDKEHSWASYDDSKVLVENGILLYGRIDKKTIGPKAGGLLHIFRLECGFEECRRFYCHIQLMINNWLVYQGASIGVADTIADERTFGIIQNIKEEADQKVKTIISNAYRGQLEQTPGNTIR